MMGDEDAGLVEAVRRGSREAAGELAKRYLRPARAVALSILHDVAGAEDIAQDAFVYALERIDDCRDPARFGAWLLRIVRSRSHNHRRDSKVARSVSLEDANLASREPAPDREAERAQLRERLLAALSELPEDRAAVLLLHDLEGWTHREIADRMEMPAGTIRSHLHHARRRLRERLRELKE